MTWTLNDWSSVRRGLLAGKHLNHLGYPRISETQPGKELEHLQYFLGDENLARRGRMPVQVPSDESECLAIVKIQHWVRERLNAMEITIETNPSSNLLVGGLGSLQAHPAWSLRNPTGTSQPIPVSISDDDPITFATRLADEYAYLQAELSHQGKSVEETQAWLEQARQDGMASRFTLDLRAHRELLSQLAAG